MVGVRKLGDSALGAVPGRSRLISETETAKEAVRSD